MGRQLLNYLMRHHWGLIATFIALGGTAYANGVLARNSVGTAQLKRGSVGTAQLKRGAVGTAEIKRGAVTLGQINAGAQAALRQHPVQPSPTPVESYNLGPYAHSSWSGNVTYYRDTNGVVHLAGTTSGTASLPNQGTGPAAPADLCGSGIGDPTHPVQMFQLPAGDHPLTTRTFAVASGTGTGQVSITPDGGVNCLVAVHQYLSTGSRSGLGASRGPDGRGTRVNAR